MQWGENTPSGKEPNHCTHEVSMSSQSVDSHRQQYSETSQCYVYELVKMSSGNVQNSTIKNECTLLERERERERRATQLKVKPWLVTLTLLLRYDYDCMLFNDTV